MQNYVIPEFSSVNYGLVLPSEMAYVEVYDKDFKFLLDSNTAKLINNTLYLYRENFQTSDFPLNVIAFSSEDGEAAIPLFNQRIGMPTNYSRLAVGRRNELARNVNVAQFADYVNEGGSIYIGKDFTGFDYNAARANLDISSKNEVRAAVRNIISQSSYAWTSQEFSFGPWMNTRNPARTGSVDWKKSKFNTTFKNGFVDVYVDFVALAVDIRNNSQVYAHRVCSVAEAVGQNWTPEQPVIAQAELASLPIETRRYGDGQTNVTEYLQSPFDFPILIFTGAPYTINGTTLAGESVYVFNQNKRYSEISMRTPSGGPFSAAFRSFPTDQRIRYHIRYAVNDAQLT